MNKRIVDCQWLNNRRIVINPDGQVLPCCYFANASYKNKNLNNQQKDSMLNKYSDNSKDLNIFTNPIDKILQHSWFDELYKSFSDSDKISNKCLTFCTINEKPS